ncbi:hypothetical protein AUR66_18085 [Haloferax profundi]|uniref:Uncharacterized protein n=2 Tax=Haloferax profundi TaxID=1544718 RepID=A0A0W1S086_9EURY|nr:hypothetical protein AUR66_18085 [Haloferax profundi]
MLGFAKYYMINVVGMKVFYYADVVLIGILMAKSSVAYYEVAWRLILTVITLNSIIANTLFSYVSNASSQGDYKSVSEDVKHVLSYIFIIPIPVFFGSIVVGNDVLTFLFTDTYMNSKLVLPILAFGLLFQTLYHLFSKILVGLDKPRSAFYATLTTVLCNIILNILLISSEGIIGAAVATTVSFVLAYVIYYKLIGHELNIEIPYRSVSIQLIAGILMFILLIYVETISSLPVMFSILLGGLAYVSVLGIVPHSRNQLLNLASKSI